LKTFFCYVLAKAQTNKMEQVISFSLPNVVLLLERSLSSSPVVSKFFQLIFNISFCSNKFRSSRKVVLKS